jgi:hypothetical protein
MPRRSFAPINVFLDSSSRHTSQLSFFSGKKREKKNGFRRKTGTMDNLVMLATDIKIRFNKKKEIYYNVNYQTNYKDARKEGIPNENTEIF